MLRGATHPCLLTPRAPHRTETETETETMSAPPGIRSGPTSCLFRRGGGYEIRTREGLPPTRFPSVRPRPLGESSVEKLTGGCGVVVHGYSGGVGAARGGPGVG